GYLACGYEGKGRLPDPEKILEAVQGLLRKKDLAGEKILITAGPSREPLDPVRYITNRSSGKMGYALARAALHRGAEVVLVSGPTALAAPAGARVIAVNTASEMRAVTVHEFTRCTIAIMAAAVADYRPAHAASKKIKKGATAVQVQLEPNPDILKELGAIKDGKFLVGFAAETEDLSLNATKKLHAKNLDMIVANDVTLEGSGFDSDSNTAAILDRSGTTRTLPLMTKKELADEILDHMIALKAKG
ncbi:MAG TPA: bifunctional phosphopantothenoylcysteine decarboxylase/phosphopantothenate--cysteine ligase CoaBC, partial [Candidatus Binatia bacterium]|nr:bifunctional phosphopantothenoylcysteine decarboxylase/phosphopantothenate--cysteine ligase CoaBC [Candidatus Binatia bacterium]